MRRICHQYPPGCSIYRVPRLVRQLKEEAYTPRVVSIGPYHYGHENLQAMEFHKTRYTQALFQRTQVPDLTYSNCYYATVSMEKLARQCYSEHEHDQTILGMDQEKLAQILLVDACFILEVLYRWENSDNDPTDPILGNAWTTNCLQHDLVLLENQIPFFVLDYLFRIIQGSIEKPKPLILQQLCVSFHLPLNLNKQPIQESLQVRHLLDIVRNYYLPRLADTTQQGPATSDANTTQQGGYVTSYTNTTQHRGNVTSDANTTPQGPATSNANTTQQGGDVTSNANTTPQGPATSNANTTPQGPATSNANTTQQGGGVTFNASTTPQGLATSNANTTQQGGDVTLESIHCATKLEERGIKFKKGSIENLFEIKFIKGVLVIPLLLIQDTTESLLRNMIAFEQCCNGTSQHITSYAMLMDRLIDTPRDVEILEQKRIITNNLGSGKDVSQLINNMFKEVVLKDFYYEALCKDVNKYYNRRWPRYKAFLARNHCSNPWRILSLVVAFLILVGAGFQTVYTVNSYYHPKK